MSNEQQRQSNDHALTVVALAGRLVEMGDLAEPYRIVDGDGVVVEPVVVYFRELQATGRSVATVRSYGMDLLRWFRFLWAIGVGWERATRVEAREFARWSQVSGKPARPHWRRRERQDVPAGRSSGRAYSVSVRVHSETVLRGFYGFHREAGTGPLLNPFPLDRSRRGRRAHAHHNPDGSAAQ
jgi:hypothetical protein